MAQLNSGEMDLEADDSEMNSYIKLDEESKMTTYIKHEEDIKQGIHG